MTRLLSSAPWTATLALGVAVLNLGLFLPWLDLNVLEYDRQAFERGEIWRVVTGSLVHWSGGHLLLDLGALVVAGVLFERSLGIRYPSVLLGAFAAVSVLLILDPAIVRYRGLSGVAAGQYAAALVAEIRHHGRDIGRDRVLSQLSLVATVCAALLFAAKLAVEFATGDLILGTARFGDIGRPLPVAHLAGVAGALSAVFLGGRASALPGLGMRIRDR